MPVDIRVIYLPQKAKSCRDFGLRKIASRRKVGVTDAHHLLRSWCRKSSRFSRKQEEDRSARDPLRVGPDSYFPGTVHYSPGNPVFCTI